MLIKYAGLIMKIVLVSLLLISCSKFTPSVTEQFSQKEEDIINHIVTPESRPVKTLTKEQAIADYEFMWRVLEDNYLRNI